MKNKATNILIDKVSEALLKEEIVCFPTETVMGVAIIAENEQTYNKLVDLKNRPANKVFPFCVLKKQIENYCEVNELQKKIIDKFLPGPLTVILKRKEGVPKLGFKFNYKGKLCKVASLNLLSQVARIESEDKDAIVYAFVAYKYVAKSKKFLFFGRVRKISTLLKDVLNGF